MAEQLVDDLASSPEVRRHLASPNTGVYIVRQDGHIVWASPSMQAVTGRAPADLVGRNGWEVFVPREDIPTITGFKVRLTDSDGMIWMRLRQPSGDPKWYRVDTWVRRTTSCAPSRWRRTQPSGTTISRCGHGRELSAGPPTRA